MPYECCEDVSAEEIAERAERGDDVSQFFTNSGCKVGLVKRVNVDFNGRMIEDLDT